MSSVRGGNVLLPTFAILYAFQNNHTEALMIDIPKMVRVLSCGFLLWVGVLCNVAQADTIVPRADAEKDSQRTGGQGDPKELSIRQQGVHIIQGDVLRVEGDTYVIKELGGKELSLRTDATTMKAEKIQVGDRIEAKVDENKRALSLVLAP
jgi:hypothetical protein